MLGNYSRKDAVCLKSFNIEEDERHERISFPYYSPLSVLQPCQCQQGEENSIFPPLPLSSQVIQGAGDPRVAKPAPLFSNPLRTSWETFTLQVHSSILPTEKKGEVG